MPFKYPKIIVTHSKDVILEVKGEVLKEGHGYLAVSEKLHRKIITRIETTE